MNINSHILRIMGKSELPHEIDETANYHISINGFINKVEFHDNEDSTWDKIYTFKPINVEVLDETGKTIKLKDPRSDSQKVRFNLHRIWSEEGIIVPFDKFYHEACMVTMSMSPEITREALKRLNQ